MTLTWLLVQLAVCAVLIGRAGDVLSRSALYVRGPLLADVSAVHAGTAVTALVMTGLVIIGLVMRPQGRALRVLSWVSVGLVAAYVVNAALVYLSTS